MSLLYKSDACSLIDHRDVIQTLYKNVEVDREHSVSFALKSKLFCMKSNEKSSINRKRNRDSNKEHEEAILINTKYLLFKDKIPEEIKLKLNSKYSISDTSEVRTLSQELFELTQFDHDGMSGGNNSDAPLRCKVKDNYYLIPPRCRFFCGDVKEQCQKLEGSKFNIIIADPPWWNKYIRRLRSVNDKLSYKMMYNEDIASIPMKDLLSKTCLVAVWCTNAPSNIKAVKELIFPNWGVEYTTTWYWLKVNIDLEPLCEFGSGCKKQPYERVILGKCGDVKNVPENQLVVSIPSALHSHKPPLLDLLKPYVAMENPQVLEIFARYLLSDTTSVGYEPLKWQHISLYEEVR